MTLALMLATAPGFGRALAQDGGQTAGQAGALPEPPAAHGAALKAMAEPEASPPAPSPRGAHARKGNKGDPSADPTADAAPTDAPGDPSAAPIETADARDQADSAGDAAADAAARAAQPPAGVAAAVADWIRDADDNGDRPFVIVDKLSAKVFVFDARGRLLGSAPALVGLAAGDDSVEGIGERPLAAIGPADRTTPAGRFVAHFGPAKGHARVLWVDYADGISLHPVVTTNPKEHRLTRIKSEAPEDHRISFGCINVPAKFYDGVVLKALKGGQAVVYVLPDTHRVEDVFPAFAAFEVAGGGAPGVSDHLHDAAATPAMDAPQETAGP